MNEYIKLPFYADVVIGDMIDGISNTKTTNNLNVGYVGLKM